MPERPPVALTIAGSDPSGGAGIQADLKTFSALGAYGTSVLTALTAQSTRGVTAVHVVPTEMVDAQLDTLLADVRVDAVKVGMLATAGLARCVAPHLKRLQDKGTPVVLDPVMVSTSGSRLLDEDAVEAVRALLPLADVVTPNLAEAGVLLDDDAATSRAAMLTQARALRDLGGRGVLLKGGHLAEVATGDADTAGDAGEAVDLLLDGDEVAWLTAPRVATRNTHGTGCTLSSALAALRPRHDGWPQTARAAKSWLTAALEHADELDVGSGPGPVHHFHDAPRWR